MEGHFSFRPRPRLRFLERIEGDGSDAANPRDFAILIQWRRRARTTGVCLPCFSLGISGYPLALETSISRSHIRYNRRAWFLLVYPARDWLNSRKQWLILLCHAN